MKLVRKLISGPHMDKTGQFQKGLSMNKKSNSKRYLHGFFRFAGIMLLAFSLTACSAQAEKPSSQENGNELLWTPDNNSSANNAGQGLNNTSGGLQQDVNSSSGGEEKQDTGSSEGQSPANPDDEYFTPPLVNLYDPDGDYSPNFGPETRYRLVIDPGHGGIFSGAVYDGRTEKNLTLRISEYLRDYLQAHYPEIEVYMTRESDIELDSDLATELEKRAIFAKEKEADIFVSLHLNASDKHDSTGVVVYYSLRENVGAESRKLAQSIQTKLVGLGIRDRGIETRKSNDLFDEEGNVYDYYAVIRHNANRDIPAVIVEHCFIDNNSDAAFLSDDNALKRLAKADAEGIAEYLGIQNEG